MPVTYLPAPTPPSCWLVRKPVALPAVVTSHDERNPRTSSHDERNPHLAHGTRRTGVPQSSDLSCMMWPAPDT